MEVSLDTFANIILDWNRSDRKILWSIHSIANSIDIYISKDTLQILWCWAFSQAAVEALVERSRLRYEGIDDASSQLFDEEDLESKEDFVFDGKPAAPAAQVVCSNVRTL